MINRIYSLPDLPYPAAEAVRTDNLFRAYKDEAQLFTQTDYGAVILLLDGNATVCGKINAEEVNRFLKFSGTKSVFSSADNLKLLFKNFKEVNVLICETPARSFGKNNFSDDLSSEQMYDILNTEGIELPPYEYFATDYCRRKNRGLIKTFAKKESCAAITLETENCRMISGIATKQKGLGGALLLAAVSGEKSVLAVCRDELLPFYIKYGFKPLYKAGYWRKWD